MAILVNNLQELYPMDDQIFGLVENLLQQVLTEHQKPEAEVSVVLVTNDYIRDLNLEYRNLDQPTDVLSFALEEEPVFSGAFLPEEAPELLGDIYISVERAMEQAKEYGHSFERELCYLATHGILHLLGFDHQTPEQTATMREQEETVLARFSLGRP